MKEDPDSPVSPTNDETWLDIESPGHTPTKLALPLPSSSSQTHGEHLRKRRRTEDNIFPTRPSIPGRSRTSSIVPTTKPTLGTRPAYPTFQSSLSTRRISGKYFVNGSDESLDVSQEKISAVPETGDHDTNIDIPRLFRRGTYSSLPPSPTGAIHELLDSSTSKHAYHKSADIDLENLQVGSLETAFLDRALEGYNLLRSDPNRQHLIPDDDESGRGDRDRLVRASSLPPESNLDERATIDLCDTSPPLDRTGMKLPRQESDDDDDDDDDDDGSVRDADEALDQTPPEEEQPFLGSQDDSTGEEVYEDAYDSLEHSMLLSGSQHHHPKPERARSGSTSVRQKLSWWDVLREAVVEEEHPSLEIQGKWDRIANFLAVPSAIEKVRSLSCPRTLVNIPTTHALSFVCRLRFLAHYCAWTAFSTISPFFRCE